MSVVITGMGAVCNAGIGIDALDRALRAGESAFTSAFRSGSSPGSNDKRPWAPLPARDLESLLAAARARGPVDRATRCAGRAPLPVRAAAACALEAWSHAGLSDGSVPSERRSLVVGGQNLNGRFIAETLRRFAEHPEYVLPSYALRHLDTDHVGVVSDLLQIQGEGLTVGGASAASSAALVQGARMIRWGVADVCLVIGALTDLSDLELAAFDGLGAVCGGTFRDDPARASRPFDARADGFVYGQGAAAVVLEDAEHAGRRGARALATLAGIALGLDANRAADPSERGEVRAMRDALRDAKIEASDVDLVSAHATSTPLGDRTEAAALREVLGDGRAWITAPKGLFGHTLCAAGVLEAVAVVLQLVGGFVHPNRNLDQPVASLRFAGPEATDADVRVGLSNSFGFGGINSAVVLTRADVPRP